MDIIDELQATGTAMQAELAKLMAVLEKSAAAINDLKRGQDEQTGFGH
jgi:hypothetical protein